MRPCADDLLPGGEPDPVREASTPFDRACTLLCISEQSFVGKRVDVSLRVKGTAVTLASVGTMSLGSGCGAAVQGGSSSDAYTIGLVTWRSSRLTTRLLGHGWMQGVGPLVHASGPDQLQTKSRSTTSGTTSMS